jgi:hypothetical protein
MRTRKRRRRRGRRRIKEEEVEGGGGRERKNWKFWDRVVKRFFLLDQYCLSFILDLLHSFWNPENSHKWLTVYKKLRWNLYKKLDHNIRIIIFWKRKLSPCIRTYVTGQTISWPHLIWVQSSPSSSSSSSLSFGIERSGGSR